MSILKVDDIEEATLNGANYKNTKLLLSFNAVTNNIDTSTNVSSVIDMFVGRHKTNFNYNMKTPFYYANCVSAYPDAGWWNTLGSMRSGTMSHTRTTNSCNISAYESNYYDVPSVGLICIGEYE